MNINSVESLLIETPCRLDAVRNAARVLRSFLASNGATEDELNAWELVIVEAGNNAVLHTPNLSGENCVGFLMNAWPDSVDLCVTDRSAGFEMPDDISLPMDDSESGRGLFIMSSLTDSVRYLKGREENFMILRRARPALSNRTSAIRPDEMEQTINMMTDELGAAFESLSAIFRFSADLGKSGNVHDCATKWLTELMKVTRTDWFVFRTYDVVTETLKLLSASPTKNVALLPVLINVSPDKTHASVEIRALADGREVWFNAGSPAWETASLSEIFGSPMSGISYPIYVGCEIFGVLTMGTLEAHTDFSVSQVSIIRTFADFLGIQLNNESVQREANTAHILHSQLQKELQIASDIQRSLLPIALPSIKGFSLAAHSQSARAVGGDFYDVVKVGDEGVLFAITDVMGKGVPAAMFATMFRSLLHARPDLTTSPGRLMEWLNRSLFHDLDRVSMFVTAQLTYLDYVSKTFTVASAGHCAALLVEGTESRLREVSGDGPPLGITLDAVYVEESVRPEAPSRLLMLTDGLIEARGKDGRMLGQIAVADCFMNTARIEAKADKVRDSLVKLAADHQNGTPSTDDLTFLLLVSNDATASQ